jgi:hypothetical protein
VPVPLENLETTEGTHNTHAVFTAAIVPTDEDPRIRFQVRCRGECAAKVCSSSPVEQRHYFAIASITLCGAIAGMILVSL